VPFAGISAKLGGSARSHAFGHTAAWAVKTFAAGEQAEPESPLVTTALGKIITIQARDENRGKKT
jgi:hypothetical protein